MSSEESCTPDTGGILLKKRKVVWRSKQLQGFLKTVRSHMAHTIKLPYADLDKPILSMRPAPAGLTVNFYDPDYLMNLSNTAREQLDVQ